MKLAGKAPRKIVGLIFHMTCTTKNLLSRTTRIQGPPLTSNLRGMTDGWIHTWSHWWEIGKQTLICDLLQILERLCSTWPNMWPKRNPVGQKPPWEWCGTSTPQLLLSVCSTGAPKRTSAVFSALLENVARLTLIVNLKPWIVNSNPTFNESKHIQTQHLVHRRWKRLSIIT